MKDRAVAGVPMGSATSPLIRAKLRPPACPEHYLRRDRLLELLDEVVNEPLTLVVAPPGAGKTSLLAGWTAESAIPTAWLTLDDADRDVSELWSGVIAALRTVTPGCGEPTLSMLRRRGDVTKA